MSQQSSRYNRRTMCSAIIAKFLHRRTHNSYIHSFCTCSKPTSDNNVLQHTPLEKGHILVNTLYMHIISLYVTRKLILKINSKFYLKETLPANSICTIVPRHQKYCMTNTINNQGHRLHTRQSLEVNELLSCWLVPVLHCQYQYNTHHSTLSLCLS